MGQQAMATALIYPDPAKTGRHKNGFAAKPLADEVPKASLSKARTVLRDRDDQVEAISGAAEAPCPNRPASHRARAAGDAGT
jgi:hypothetical protein